MHAFLSHHLCDQLFEWCTLFDVISNWEYDSECAERLREAAADFASYFRVRLVDLKNLERAKENEVADHEGTSERDRLTAASTL